MDEKKKKTVNKLKILLIAETIILSIIIGFLLYQHYSGRPDPYESELFDIYEIEDTAKGKQVYLYVDKDTKIEYLWISNGNAASLCMMVDAFNQPLLYNGDLPSFKRIQVEEENENLYLYIDNRTNVQYIWIADAATAGACVYMDENNSPKLYTP